MSKPSFSNIDLWLFELAEGNLSPEQIEALELFLLQHPELDLERDVWEMAHVTPTPMEFPDVQLLERKRRPVAFMLASTLAAVLLLVGIGVVHYDNEDTMANVVMGESLGKKTSSMMSMNTVRTNEGNRAAENQQVLSQLPPASYITASMVAPINEHQSHADGNLGLTGNYAVQQTSTTYVPMRGSVAEPLNPLLANALTETPLEEVELGTQGQDKSLRVRKAAEISFDYGGSRYRLQHTPRVNTTSTSVPHVSMKTRMTRFGRTLQRMMDNPIALKNSREPNYLVPGMTNADINFASAGTLLSTRIQTLSRWQWGGQSAEQWMNQIAIDGYAYGLRGGWGMQVQHQYYKDGGIQVGQVALSYSPKFSVSNTISVEPALRFKMGQKQLNSASMNGVEQVEIDRGNAVDFYPEGDAPIGKNLWYKDLGAGVLVNTKWFFAGVQVDNLFRYVDNYYSVDINDPKRAPHQFIATAGTDWVSRDKNTALSPYAVYQHSGALSEAWLGCNARWKWISAGAALSNQLDPAASVGLKFNKFNLSYQVDYLTSSMSGERSLSHQMTLRFIPKQNRLGQR